MNKKYKVCHFSSVHKDNDIRVYAKECLTLAGAGYDTTLIACDGQQTSEYVKLIKIKEGGGRFKRIFLRAYEVYRIARNAKADIYHFHDPELLPYGFLIKMTTHAKVIYDSHECYPEDLQNKEWLPKYLRIPVAKIYKFIEDIGVRKFDMVVAATPYIHKRFEGIAKKIITVNNYPKLQEFRSESDTNPSIKRDGVCYVGAISEIRGILPFLDSLANVNPDVKVYVAGTFATENIKKLVFAHSNWARVEYSGQVNRMEIRNIYEKSFAGIVNFLRAPNHEFSQPNKLFEYMAAGMPVIASDFQLWKDIIEPTACGITVKPDSASEIANAITALYVDKKLAESMGQAGRKAISDKYSWEREGVVLVDAYNELTAA
jgi:glycosyltransferase involved in cell wall biosynthesis